MLYIVSGASRSGKSLVAQTFLQRKRIPYLPLDSLMMGFMHGVPSMGIHDQLWPHEIAAKMWPFLEAMCENMLANNMDYLFEGEAVWPQNLKTLTDRYPGQIKVCFLGFAEVDVARKIADVKRYPNHERDWLVSQTEAYIASHLENMKGYSLRIKEECRTFGFQYFDTSDCFEDTLETVLAFLDSDP